jgi:hypothetical protein
MAARHAEEAALAELGSQADELVVVGLATGGPAPANGIEILQRRSALGAERVGGGKAGIKQSDQVWFGTLCPLGECDIIGLRTWLRIRELPLMIVGSLSACTTMCVQAEDEFLVSHWQARAPQGPAGRHFGAMSETVDQERVWVTSTQLEAALGPEEALRLRLRFQEEEVGGP